MSHKILKDGTQKIVFRSKARPGDNSLISNLAIDPTTVRTVIKHRQDTFEDDDIVSTTPSTIQLPS